eukprot:COSAG04_NODE_2139_length_4717_cov_1.826981_2_plen_752_part_00
MVVNGTWISSAWVDGAGFLIPVSLFFCVYPTLPDRQLEMNIKLVDSMVADNINVPGTGGTEYDGNYGHFDVTEGYWLLTGTRFLRNGIFTPAAVGPGGLVIKPPPGGSLTPTMVFEDSEWVGNGNPMGPAVYSFYGQVNLQFRSCVFRLNEAYKSGGAIFVLGSEASTLMIQDSTFDANAVRVAADAAVDVTVRLNTGAFPIAWDDDGAMTLDIAYIPVWRIDDGPVRGIPWEYCKRAEQFSRASVAKGFPPSWPSDFQCANLSYTGPDSTYNEIVTLSEGSHSLWAGLCVDTNQQNFGWQQAWIEVVDAIGPLFPTMPDQRFEEFADENGNCVGTPEECRPRGMVMWARPYEFRASSGKGGAVVVSGPATVIIRGTIFSRNVAPKAASLAITAAASLRVVNTTIDKPVDAGSGATRLVATAVATCAENPCDVGSKCTFSDWSTFCQVCRENEIGDGVSCSTCQPGTQPDDTRAQCLLCPPAYYSSIGICIACPAGKFSLDDRTTCVPCQPGTYRSAEESLCVHCPAGSQPNTAKTACESCTVSGPDAYSPDGRECRDCPARNAPNYERTNCFCQTNTYSAADLGTLVTCHGTSFRSDGVKTDACAVCPACLDCDTVGETKLKRGWAFFGAGEAYQCPGWNNDFVACPALLLNENTTLDSSTCALGYEGPVCGNCQPDFNHLKVGNPCDPCDDGVINVPLVMGLFLCAMAVGGAVISGALGVLQDFGVITDLRILVGFYQILGQASNVLDL